MSGHVQAAENVDLAFETSGWVMRAGPAVGEPVKQGAVLAQLENDEQSAQVAQAQANLAMENANLAELKRGARAEDVAVSQAKVTAAQQAFSDAQVNLSSVTSQSSTKLATIYAGVKDTVISAYLNAADAITKQIADLFIMSNYLSPRLNFSTTNQQAQIDAEAGRAAITDDLVSFQADVAKISTNYSNLNDLLTRSSSHLSAVQTFLARLQDALSASPSTSATTLATYRVSLNTARMNVNTALANITAKQKDLANERATDNAAGLSAQATVNTALNNLATAQAELTLKQAGATPEQLQTQEAKVAAARANVELAQSKLEKTTLRAPFAGIIIANDAKVGELAVASKSLVSILAENGLEIEAFVPETDIVKVKVGQDASFSLDALGSVKKFKAEVLKVDPAETVFEGVATYKVTFSLVQHSNEIRSGMSADMMITTNEARNVLAVPKRLIHSKDSQSFITLKQSETTTVEVPVNVGLTSEDGYTEIQGPVKAGDQAVLPKS